MPVRPESSRLSLEACRQILGEDAPADERLLEKQRDDAYSLARLLLEIYLSQKAGNPSPELPEDS
jgi:hypothetical protein